MADRPCSRPARIEVNSRNLPLSWGDSARVSALFYRELKEFIMVEHAVDEKVIFLAALEQASQPLREAYLQGACAGDPELLRRVKELLSVHQESHGPLDAPPPGLGQGPTIDEPITEHPGTLIGPYQLLERIGEGGFRDVFMAEQQHPLRRKVALNELKPGMDPRRVFARALPQRPELALLDH